MPTLNLNERSAQLVTELMNKANELKISTRKSSAGATIIDCGVKTRGSYEAGKYLTEICLAGLGKVRLTKIDVNDYSLPATLVSTSSPSLACLGSQMAGWKIKIGKYFALASGPARILAEKPREIYELLKYHEQSKVAVLVLEANDLPPEAVLHEIAEECNVKPRRLYVLVAPTTSLSGSTQVSGRAAEAGLHKLLKLGFDVRKIRTARGIAPIAPVIPDYLKMMGRVNDMILAAGQAWYKAEVGKIRMNQLVARIPSSTSSDYGTPFYEVLKKANFDFYKVDPELFSVAEVTVTDIKTGKSYHAGRVNFQLLKESLGLM